MEHHQHRSQTRISRRRMLQASGTLGAASALSTAGLALSPAERALAEEKPDAVKLDVLFIGAHPDDEAGTLAALGQWNEFHDVEVGVITATRGEGGGNAVGLEEGPALGLLREVEERDAVALAGIEHIYNLDALDFYYTASAPLSREVWGGDELLGRIIRVVRATRPEVIVTMNPSAVEGNHGNHQQAAMYALEAYLGAGDPEVFPEHLEEGFAAWSPSRILRSGANGDGPTGPDSVSSGFTPAVESDLVFGTWEGTESERHGKRWSAVKDEAIWTYASQGWAERPASPSDPESIVSTWFTVLHSRAPLVDPTTGDDAALRGAALPIEGGLPHGTRIEVATERYEFVGGEPLTVRVTVTAPSDQSLRSGSIEIAAPEGWLSSQSQPFPKLDAGSTHEAEFELTAGGELESGSTARVAATVTAGDRSGTSSTAVRVSGALESTIEPLEEIGEFREWTRSLDLKHLDALVPELFAVGQGRTRELTIVTHNYSAEARGGTVEISVPEGFEVSPSRLEVDAIAAGEEVSHTVEVSSTDTSLPAANRAEDEGAWPVTIRADSKSSSAERTVTMNLVPSRTVEQTSTPPTIDGVLDDGEYPGEPLLVDAIWEGEGEPGGTTDSVSGQAWLTFDEENLFVFVSVTDDVRGTILPADDNKRQRRTDSVEIYVDPRGNAANTAQTFIAGIMPSMDSMTGPVGVGRDRDNHQGVAEETAPGMEVAVTMAQTEEEYSGYDLEVKIPFDILPDSIDPAHMGFNVLINDSDTQNQTAQVRVGWSTFAGVRADPWRWGQVTLEGLDDPGSEPVEAILPSTAALSVDSPQSILQSAADGVPLGGQSPTDDALEVASVAIRQDRVVASLKAPVTGTAKVFVWDGESILAQTEQTMPARERTVSLPVKSLQQLLEDGADLHVAASFAADGKVSAATAHVD